MRYLICTFKLQLWVFWGIIGVSLLGCASERLADADDSGDRRSNSFKDDDIFKVSKEETSDFVEKWRSKAEETRKAPMKIPEKEPDLIPVEEDENEKKKTEEPVVPRAAGLPAKPVTIEVVDSSVKAVLRALGRMVAQDMIISEHVKGKCTVNFENTPWNQAFRRLVQTNGLGFSMENDIVHVYSVADLKKQRKFEKAVAKSGGKDQPEVKKAYTRSLKIEYLDVENVKDVIESIFEKRREFREEDRRVKPSVVMEKEQNTLILHGSARDVNRGLRLVSKLDQPSKQVRLEARIVVANESTARELGMQWGGAAASRGKWRIFPGANARTDYDITAKESGYFSHFPSAFLTSGSDATTGGQTTDTTETQNLQTAGFGIGAEYYDADDLLLQTQLSALEQEGQLQVLSTPSITTTDNQEAYIESGSEIPYQSSSDDSGTTTEFKEAVLKLEVRPKVVENGFVKLKVLAQNDAVDKSLANADAEPGISKREAKTNVLLADGETTVMAGLAKRSNTNSTSGVPFLKDIPAMGRLFSNINSEMQLNQLLIFITPHILDKRDIADTAQEHESEVELPGERKN